MHWWISQSRFPVIKVVIIIISRAQLYIYNLRFEKRRMKEWMSEWKKKKKKYSRLLVVSKTTAKITQKRGWLDNLKTRILTLSFHPQVKLLPKQGTFLSRKTRQANQPFETTFRLQVRDDLQKKKPTTLNSHYFYSAKKYFI